MDPIQQEIADYNAGEVMFQQAKQAMELRREWHQKRQPVQVNPIAEGFPKPQSTPSTAPKAVQATEAAFDTAQRHLGDAGAYKPVQQHTDVACGQASAACAINALEKKEMSSKEFEDKYGFNLLTGLNAESSQYAWRDAGNFDDSMWAELEQKAKQGIPTIIGLNGPEFSPSGRGHIVTINDIQGEKVSYVDPADGKVKFTTKKNIASAPAHPDGKFVFTAESKKKDKLSPANIKFKPKESQQEAMVNAIGESYGLNSEVFFKTLMAESNLDPAAVSEAGAKGVGQLMPDTWEKEVLPEMKAKGLIPPSTKPQDYDDNFSLQLKASAYYLKKMKDQYKTNARALAAYNMGPGALAAALKGEGSIYAETKNYVAKIGGITPEEAEEAILSGKDPKGLAGKASSLGGVATGHPGKATVEFVTGNPKAAEDFNKKGKLDPVLSYLAFVNPEQAERILSAIKDDDSPFDTKEVIAKNTHNYTGSELAEAMMKKAMNSFTFGYAAQTKNMPGLEETVDSVLGFALPGYQAVKKAKEYGVLPKASEMAPDKRDYDVLEEAGSTGHWLKKGLVNYGPSFVGDIAGMFLGMGIGNAVARGTGQAAMKMAGKEALETSSSKFAKMLQQAATDPQFLNTQFGKYLAITGSKGLGGNIKSGLYQGIVFGLPVALSEASWEYQRAKESGLTEEQQAAAGFAAFTHTMKWSAGISAALPGIGIMGVGLGTVGKDTVKHLAGTAAEKVGAKALYQGSAAEALVEGAKAFSWRSMDAAKKVPLLGASIKAVESMAAEGRESFARTFKSMMDQFQIEDMRIKAGETLTSQIDAISALKQTAASNKAAQHSILDETTKGLQNIDQLQAQAVQVKEKLLSGTGVDPQQLGAVMAPDNVYKMARSARTMEGARTNIRASLFDADGAPVAPRQFAQAMKDFKDGGLTGTDVNTLLTGHMKMAQQAKDLNIISGEEFELLAREYKAVQQQASALPPVQPGKKGQNEGVKRFVDQQKEAIVSPMETYKEAVDLAQKLGDGISEDALTKIDALRHKLKGEKGKVLNNALSQLYKFDGSVAELKNQFKGGLDFVNAETGGQVLGKHVANQDELLGELMERADKLDGYLKQQYARLPEMTPEELAQFHQGEVTLGEVLNAPASEKLENVLKGSLRVSSATRPAAEFASLRSALDERLGVISEGMQWNQFTRHKETLKTVKRGMQNHPEVAKNALDTANAAKEAFAELGIDGADEFVSGFSKYTNEIFERYKQIATDARTILRRDMPVGQQPGNIKSQISQLQSAQAFIESGNLDEANALFQGLLTKNGFRELLNDPRKVSLQFEELNASLADRIATAKTPDDVAKIVEDMSNALNMKSNSDLEEYFTKLDNSQEYHLRALEKSLARTGNDVSTNTVISDLISNAGAYEETGANLAKLYRTRFAEATPDIMGRISERLVKDAPGADISTGAINRELMLSLHDVLSGANPKAIDNLIQKGITYGDKTTGPLPEIAELLSPIKKLADHVKNSPGSDEIFDLMHYHQGDLMPKFSRLELAKQAVPTEQGSALFEIAERINRRAGEGSTTLFKTQRGQVIGLQSKKNPYTIRDAMKQASFAEQELARAYKVRTGKDMPDNYWQEILLNPKRFDPEYLKDKFLGPDGVPYSDPKILERKAAALAYKSLAPDYTPDVLIGNYVQAVSEANASRHMLNSLSKLQVPGSEYPFIVDKSVVGEVAGYRPLTDDAGNKLPLRGLQIENVKVGSENILVHKDLHKMLSTHFTRKEATTRTFGQELSSLIKHTVLTGSPFYFLTLMSGQLLKESRYSLSKALGMVSAGRSAMQTGNHEIMAAALDSGLNYATFTKMMGQQSYTATKQTGNLFRRAIQGLDKGVRNFDEHVNKHTFEAIREAQLGAWTFKSREYFDSVGKKLMQEGGYTYQEAMRESQRLAAKHVNKTFSTLHSSFMSDGGSRFFRGMSLASGLNTGRLAQLTDAFYAAKEKALMAMGKGRGKRYSFETGAIDPVLQQKYHKEALAAVGIGMTMSYVYANALSYMLNGHSTLHNAPGKEDQIRIGDNYFKPGLHGFDNAMRRIVRALPTGQLIDKARGMAGDDRTLTAGAAAQLFYTATGLMHPIVQSGLEFTSGKTPRGEAIYLPHQSGWENTKRAAGWAADKVPLAKTFSGKSFMTGKEISKAERFADVAGVGYISPSPPAREGKQYANQINMSLQTKLGEDVEAMLVTAAHTTDPVKKQELIDQALQRAVTGEQVPDRFKKVLGVDVIRMSPQAFKNKYRDIIDQDPYNDVRKTVRSARPNVMRRAEEYTPDYDAGVLGERY